MQGNQSLQAKGAAADEAMAFARTVTKESPSRRSSPGTWPDMPDEIRVRGLFFEKARSAS